VTRRLLTVVAVASLALLSTGCAAELDETPQQTAAATQSGPDPEALLERLGEIDPGLDAQSSVADADELCLDIEAGDSDAELAETARSLFGERAGGELGDEQVTSIVEAVKGDYCG
jgi:predicted outer membrane protein